MGGTEGLGRGQNGNRGKATLPEVLHADNNTINNNSNNINYSFSCSQSAGSELPFNSPSTQFRRHYGNSIIQIRNLRLREIKKLPRGPLGSGPGPRLVPELLALWALATFFCLGLVWVAEAQAFKETGVPNPPCKLRTPASSARQQAHFSPQDADSPRFGAVRAPPLRPGSALCVSRGSAREELWTWPSPHRTRGFRLTHGPQRGVSRG